MALLGVARRWMRPVDGGGAAPPPVLLRSFDAVRHYHQLPYEAKVGIPNSWMRWGRGVENYAAKLEAEMSDLDKLLVTRTLRLKKLGIKCQHLRKRDNPLSWQSSINKEALRDKEIDTEIHPQV